MVVLFVCAFEFGPGPIVWLYISEICNDAGASAATSVNWVFTLIISIITPYMLNEWFHGYTWPIIAVASTIVSFLTQLTEHLGFLLHFDFHEGNKR